MVKFLVLVGPIVETTQSLRIMGNWISMGIMFLRNCSKLPSHASQSERTKPMHGSVKREVRATNMSSLQGIMRPPIDDQIRILPQPF
ncbi:hypothetical protein O6P43_002064 [Quillaja saponaria]|uniref:Uncharacterized protein n=1 Tax=Quillaja saponaria TaxID=32244 RepID=A0AAD7QC36_QUISA|nr:hypothetical protein O6P43_002064 [Quillaja saponaria]